jgi:uncharacterized protein (DUF58 family)
MRRDVEYAIDPVFDGETPDDEWSSRFERRIRDVASRAVAHLKRGDGVTVRTLTGDRVRADSSVGADPILRFLALLEAIPASALPDDRRAQRGVASLPPPAREPITSSVGEVR